MAKPFVSLSLIGDKKLIRKLNSLEPRDVKRALKQGMVAALEPVKARAQYLAPVKSGRLRRSIKIVQYSGRHYVGGAVKTGTRKQLRIPANAEHYYPAAHEYGTQDMRARPFMRKALADKKKEALRRIENDIRRALESNKL